MTGVVRGTVVLVLLATLAAGVVGPCLCGPREAGTRPAHECCGPETGLRPASAGCCGPAQSTPDAALAGSGNTSAAPSAVPHAVRLAPAVLVLLPALNKAPLATSPPPVLRV